MKKTYLAPTSETLRAILKDMCDGALDDPGSLSTGSVTSTNGNSGRFAPRATHAV